MAVSIKDLRYRTKQILSAVKRGEKPLITFRGHPVAQIIPVKKKETNRFNPIGFGMWNDHEDMKEPQEWLKQQRNPRYTR